jgi:integrase
MEAVRHKLMDNRVQLYQRPNSPAWWCSCTIDGKQHRASTKEDSLSRAKDIARDWYLRLLGKLVAGDLAEPTGAGHGLRDVGRYLAGEFKDVGKRTGGNRRGVTFEQASDQFLTEITALAKGERNPKYTYFKKITLNTHLLPFFKDMLVTEITPGVVQDYRVHRMTSRTDKKTGEVLRPARNTIHQDIVTLRQVLKTANRHGWLPYLPDLSTPYKASGKVGHRAWFSPEEWKTFYEATRERAKNPPHNRGRWKTETEDFHDICLIMVNTGLRPDEAKRIQFRDVAVVNDKATGKRILEIAVRGKRGTGWCKSMPNAVWPFQRLSKRHNFQPTDLVFDKRMREMMNAVLAETGLKQDREGNMRSSYSFRHTYISFRLSEGADIYQIAKNCRTSVEMIEKHYAIHIKDMINTEAVNRRKPAPAKAKPPQKARKSTTLRTSAAK